jgi:exopolysaccharide biosynthesis polyprenyl glycosylphosphotransferase
VRLAKTEQQSRPAASELPERRTPELADRRRRSVARRRHLLVRRALLVADAAGLVAAFAVAEHLLGASRTPSDNRLGERTEILVFLASLPIWIGLAKLYGLYGQDEERTDHSTADDFIPILHMLTVGLWLFIAGSWITNLAQPQVPKLLLFWALAVLFVTGGRALARRVCQRSPDYIQNTLVVGAGEVGRLIARKLAQHPEYGLNLVGCVGVATEGFDLPVLGPPERLLELVQAHEVERVVLTPTDEPIGNAVAVVHRLKNLNVQIDIVPDMFEVVGPGVDIHTIEGVALIGLPPTRLPRASMILKRTVDVALAAVGLVLTAPFFAYAAWRIRRESPGPVLFRQTRLGLNMREITMLKFRTMSVGADENVHKDYIRSIMNRQAAPESHGLYKLERPDEITPFGRWLRQTSLDELPQLVNVLRGDMSFVGPRPCLAYETEEFEPHHFERFNVMPGLTGLWQVTARARSTFREALEMDVAYARGWSLGLDLWLLARTPYQLLRRSGTT